MGVRESFSGGSQSTEPPRMAFKGEEELPKAIILDLADHLFLLTGTADASDAVKAEAKDKALELIKEHSMSVTYQKVAKDLGFSPDAALVAEMKTKNEEELKGIEEKLADAKENLGDMEVRDFLLEKADCLARVGDKEAALEAYDETMKMSSSLGQKLDLVFAKIRLGLFFNDLELVNKQVDTAQDMLATGGDWERRNRLKVYEGLYKMMTRDFTKAAELFLSALATFTCTELFDYERFIFYSTMLALVALDRQTLREKVIKAPE